ncbi:hypothetical protein [Methylotenera mobilis]|uniref:PAS domain-containing protein n=1 Tax=Methylotenera mobilis (strain JLW8 / ATCC BAA-1282 / DSM 17540) TaxID=583345 RepID=C6WWJ5_METML|nr:hypothetical protein [Methylotenera mobilis]ACT48294.1 hypothetical protein Mmol_1388 [Methylotenera mobilis JLW8]
MNTSSNVYQLKNMMPSDLLNKHEDYENTGLNLPELTVYDNGMIRSCSKDATKLLGCSVDKLRWRHVSTILPQLSGMAITEGGQINQNLRYLSHIGYHFDVVDMQGEHIACALFFNEVECYGKHYLRVIFRPAGTQYSVV